MSIHPMQAMIDGMNAAAKRERAATQMTLGGLIAALESRPASSPVAGIEDPHSYRGYYEDLAFELVPEKTSTAAEVAAICQSAMGRVFEGYKGGDFMMGESTPVWIANYGCCGVKIVSLREDGTFETMEDEY